MTSRTIRRVGSAAIERRQAKINAEIATLAGLPQMMGTRSGEYGR